MGDSHVKPAQLVAMLEGELMKGRRNGRPPVDGILVTNRITDGRVRLGSQVVKTLVEKGFTGDDKWRSVILVATFKDRLEEEYDPNEELAKLHKLFFEEHADECQSVVIGKHDERGFEDLLERISKLPALAVTYQPPPAKELAHMLASILGFHELDQFVKDLEAARREIERLNERKHRAKVLGTCGSVAGLSPSRRGSRSSSSVGEHSRSTSEPSRDRNTAPSMLEHIRHRCSSSSDLRSAAPPAHDASKARMTEPLPPPRPIGPLEA